MTTSRSRQLRRAAPAIALATAGAAALYLVAGSDPGGSQPSPPTAVGGTAPPAGREAAEPGSAGTPPATRRARRAFEVGEPSPARRVVATGTGGPYDRDERAAAEEQAAAQARADLLDRNIESLLAAAAEAEASGHPERASLMRRRVELLEARRMEVPTR